MKLLRNFLFIVVFTVVFMVVLTVVFTLVIVFLLSISIKYTPDGYGKDTILYLNNKCQIGKFADDVNLYCSDVGTIVENVYKYRLDKEKKIIYIIGKKNEENVYGILNYKTNKYTIYNKIDYFNNHDKNIFLNKKKFKVLE